MKRIQLFEFEDQNWFPNVIRMCMTRLIVVMHNLLGTEEILTKLLINALKRAPRKQILDLCSGSAGPMPGVLKKIKSHSGLEGMELILSDLYPNHTLAASINNQKDDSITYITNAVDATSIEASQDQFKTLICSLHHFAPAQAKSVLKSAKDSGHPILIFEISDNSFPKMLWWTAIPINILMALFITPMVRPMTWQQLLFTYLIPIIPLCFAWDGAVSNARTYTLEDMDTLLEGLESPQYQWEKGMIKGKSKNLYLLGISADSLVA